MKDFMTILKKYITFEGRATRKEYWMFILFNIITILSLILISMLEIQIVTHACIQCLFLYVIIITIPIIAVSIRRLHDTGRSGWWYCINCIPYIGFVVFLVFMLKKSDIGSNKYGRIT